MTKKQQKLIEVLELAEIDLQLPYIGRVPGRPQEDRSCIARAFFAKAVYNMPTTEYLIDRLDTDKSLRRICGWERRSDVPSNSTFSRAFAEFAESQLITLMHDSIIEHQMGDQLIGHISRDSTAITAREKPVAIEEKKPKKRGRPKKGEIREKVISRIEKQSSGISLNEMIEDLPVACKVGTKRNSKGYKSSWIGYKLHIDSADNGIPISCIISSASMHDSQAAIPLAEMSNLKVDSCYDLMDAAYDDKRIKAHSKSLGHIPIIDENPRTKERKAEIKLELKSQHRVGHKYVKDIRYNERSTVERVNGRLKDEFGGRTVRVRGAAKVMTHLMFGIVALTVDQLMRYAE
jgi:hypothetical protein